MVKKTLLLAIAGIALTAAAPGVYAQAKGKASPKPAPAATPAPAPVAASSSGIGAGDTELNFFGSLSDSDLGVTTINLGVALGAYMTDDLELKFTQILTIADADDASIFGYNPYGSVEYQIRPAGGGPFVAYVGGGAGLNLLTIDAGGFDFFTYSLYLTPVAGAKYFIDERLSLTYSLSYQFPLLEETCDSTTCVDSDTTTLQNFLGFSFYY